MHCVAEQTSSSSSSMFETLSAKGQTPLFLQLRTNTLFLLLHPLALVLQVEDEARDRLPERSDHQNQQEGVCLLAGGEVDAVIVDDDKGGEGHQRPNRRSKDLRPKGGLPGRNGGQPADGGGGEEEGEAEQLRSGHATRRGEAIQAEYRLHPADERDTDVGE